LKQEHAAASQFFRGIADVWRGFGLLVGTPKLWPWAILPFILNILLFILIWGTGYIFIEDWMRDRFYGQESGWLSQTFYWLLVLIFWFMVLLSFLFLFVPLATIVASPFNDMLSEGVEKILMGGRVEDAFSVRNLLRSTTIGMVTSIRLALETWLILLCILPLHFIPMIGSILATGLSTFIVVRYLSLEFTSYSMDRRFWKYERRQSWLRNNRSRSLGLATMSFTLMSIPLVNALFIPISAIAGTLLFHDTVSARNHPS
jgi:CysZ protein